MSELAQKSGGKIRRTILRDRDSSSDIETQLTPDQVHDEIASLHNELALVRVELDTATNKLNQISTRLDAIIEQNS